MKVETNKIVTYTFTITHAQLVDLVEDLTILKADGDSFAWEFVGELECLKDNA